MTFIEAKYGSGKLNLKYRWPWYFYKEKVWSFHALFPSEMLLMCLAVKNSWFAIWESNAFQSFLMHSESISFLMLCVKPRSSLSSCQMRVRFMCEALNNFLGHEYSATI